MDFLTRQKKLQAEAKMALAMAKPMAKMQVEVEKQNRKKSPVADLVSGGRGTARGEHQTSGCLLRLLRLGQRCLQPCAGAVGLIRQSGAGGLTWVVSAPLVLVGLGQTCRCFSSVLFSGCSHRCRQRGECLQCKLPLVGNRNIWKKMVKN